MPGNEGECGLMLEGGTRRCGAPRDSSIHNLWSNNTEIRTAAHAYVEGRIETWWVVERGNREVDRWKDGTPILHHSEEEAKRYGGGVRQVRLEW